MVIITKASYPPCLESRQDVIARNFDSKSIIGCLKSFRAFSIFKAYIAARFTPNFAAAVCVEPAALDREPSNFRGLNPYSLNSQFQFPDAFSKKVSPAFF
jgi:hypothetical protein